MRPTIQFHERGRGRRATSARTARRARRARRALLAPAPTPRAAALAAVALLGAAAAVPTLATAQAATDLRLVALEGAGAGVSVVGEPVVVTDRAGYDNQPAFTADGRGLLYTSIRDGQADTYRYDLASGRSTRVTRTGESEYSPTPIPGRDRFSAVRVEADSTQRLWSFDLEGGDPRLVLERIAPVGYHAWAAPDRVALFVLGEPPTLQVADTGTGEAVRVAAGIGRSLQPVPGRGAVSFTQELDGEWWLRELDLASGSLRSIVRLLGPDDYHAWLPDGVVLTAHGSRLYRLDTDAGEWRTVADLAPFGLDALTRLAVSPDGTRLAVVVDRPQPE